MEQKEKVLTIEEFEALPLTEKKRLIARDVIENLNAAKFSASKGHYVRSWDIIHFQRDLDIRENFDKLEHCRVCALGACLLSTTKYRNKLKFGDINDLGSGDKAFKLLDDIFSAKELWLIENCFEGYSTEDRRVARNRLNYEDKKPEKTARACNEFYSRYWSSNDRLIAIMNIIIEKGDFKLEYIQ